MATPRFAQCTIMFIAPQVVSCYLVMVIYHLHFMDRSKVFRYIGFAQQAFRELKPAQQVSTVPEPLATVVLSRHSLEYFSSSVASL